MADLDDIVIMIVVALLVVIFIKYLVENIGGGRRTVKEPAVEPVIEDDMVRSEMAPVLTREPGNTVLELLNVADVTEIARNFRSLDEITELMKKAGLTTVDLIIGVDYTASNYKQGANTFGGRSLHDVSTDIPNPYQQVISTLGATLQPLSSTGVIPAFGFGDSSTRDIGVFPLKKMGDCQGFEDVLQVYDQITPSIRLSGPTNFAPLIYRAISIVEKTKTYHILVIVADGQVTRELETRKAIVQASDYALSIIMIGVGDGPWDEMSEYDDQLPDRKFDNFHFVDFHKIMASNENLETAFAIQALVEIPDQYKSVRLLGYAS